MGRLDEKVVIITGGAQGMGYTHAEVLKKEGAKVIITDINEEVGNATAQKLGVTFYKQDVSNESDWKEIVKNVVDEYGQIDVLVNNAGITFNTPMEELSLDDYMKIVNINQVSVFLGMKAVSPYMKEKKQGSIVNISSMNGLIAGAIGYTDTKFAVRGMTKSAAQELSPYNVRVNSVHPGVIQTPMLEGEDVKEAVEEMKKTIPMRKIGQPEEVSKMVVFLASDDSTYSTGSEFVIDGGLTI